MKPIAWILHWVDPTTGEACEQRYTERSRARGAVIVARAQGLAGVRLDPVFSH